MSKQFYTNLIRHIPLLLLLPGVVCKAADVGGAMPFSITGGLINSPFYGGGILAPNVSATIRKYMQLRSNLIS